MEIAMFILIWLAGFLLAKYIFKKIIKNQYPESKGIYDGSWVSFIMINLLCLGSFLTLVVLCFGILLYQITEWDSKDHKIKPPKF